MNKPARPIFVLRMNSKTIENANRFAQIVAEAMHFEVKQVIFDKISGSFSIGNDLNADLAVLVENYDASMAVFEIHAKEEIQQVLNRCRTLRIPYIVVKPDQHLAFDKIAVPVTFLVEDKEKGPFAAAFGRFFKSRLYMYQPRDYGSKAEANLHDMQKLFDTFNLQTELIHAQKDSSGVEREAVLNAKTNGLDFAIISASREYGLDDVIFGCKERRILKHSEIPVMLINPRADLYTLCD